MKKNKKGNSGSGSGALERAAKGGGVGGGGTSASGGVFGRLRNATLSVQRRWANLTADSGRQAAIDAFLGLRPTGTSSFAASDGASADAAVTERLPPLYLCAGAEVPPEHEGSDDGSDGEEEEEKEEVVAATALPSKSNEKDIEAIQAALAASSVGEGDGEEEEQKKQEPLHPLDG